MTVFKNELGKKRTYNSLFVLVVLVAAVSLYKYSIPLLRIIFNTTEIADLGAEPLQPAVLGMVYVCFGVVFSTLMASFIAPQLKENSFNTWSRFGILFCLLFLGYCFLVGSIQ